MTVTNWNTVIIDGKSFLEIDVAKFRVPLEWDPSSGVFIAVAAPNGGLGNFPALLAGDDGDPPDIDTAIDFTVLEPGDATPDWASFTETSPNVYKLSLGLHKGTDGTNGSLTLDPTDYGSPVAGQMLVVAPGATSFGLQSQKTGLRYLPALMAAVPTGNPAYTVCAVPVPAQLFDWYPRIDGQSIITGTGADVRVDLIARLSTSGISNAETAGPEVARGFGGLGANALQLSTVFSSARKWGNSASYGKVLAGNSAIIYFRTERQAGANTFSTDEDTTLFEVTVEPVQ